MIKNFVAAVPNYNYRVRKIAQEQPSYFRTEIFYNLLNNCKKLLLKLINCQNGRATFLTASGTGAMNASVINLTNNKDKILIINGGRFGKRWIEICSYYHRNYKTFNTEFGKNIDLKLLEQNIQKIKPTFILMQHNETSAMQLFPVEQIGKICHQYNIKLLVDAISSFGIEKYQMNKWNVYATIISTNKGIGTYPGLSCIVLSQNAQLHNSSDYYFDLTKYIDNYKNALLPFTPNIISIKQLNYQLNYFNRIGLDTIIHKIHNRAILFRTLIKKLPLQIIAETPSNCGTALYTCRNDVMDLFDTLQKKNIYFAPEGGKTGKKLIISHIGEQTNADVYLIVEELKKWLKK